MIRFAYHRSFLKATDRIHALVKVIERFQEAMESRQWPHRLGITHLRGSYFEFRVVYWRSGDLVQYILYGSHEAIRRFLKSL